MKKTLIALLALAGVACGATVAGDAVTLNLKKAIQEYGYTTDCSFLLEAVVNTAHSARFFTFNTNPDWFLYSQENKYFGVTTSGDPGNWIVSSSGATNFTENLVVGETKSWLVGPKSTSTVTITLTCSPISADDLGQYAASLRVVASDGTVLIQSSLLDAEGGQTACFDLKGVAFNTEVTSATLNIANAGGTVLNNFDVVNYIPEPATATLSLLALAGLAARRRRK